MKPDAWIFNLALRELGFSANQALMVGDTWNVNVVAVDHWEYEHCT